MRAIGGTPRLVAAGGLLGAIALAGCSALSGQSPVPPVTSQPANSAVSASAPPPVATSAATSPSPAGLQNMTATQRIRGELLAAYVALRNIPESDVAGTRPGTVYYAYDPAANTYWAQATFEPSSTAPLSAQVNFQDGGDHGLFKKVGTGSWQAALDGVPAACGVLRFFPRPVLTLWSQPTTLSAGMSC